METSPVPSAKPAPSLRDVCAVLFRRKWVVIGILLPFLVLVTAGTMLPFSVYEARAKLLVQQERFALLHVPNEMSKPFIAQDPGEEILNSQIELLQSQSLLEAVVQAQQLHVRPPCPGLNPGDGLTTRVRVGVCRGWRLLLGEPLTQAPSASKQRAQLEQAVLALQSELKITPIKKSKLISIRYQDRDPELAARVVNDLIDRFRSRHMALSQTDGAYEFYRSEAQILRDRLVDAEERLQQFRQRAGIFDLTHQKQLNLEKMSGFESELRTAEADLASTQAQIQRLNAQLAAEPERILSERREIKNSALDGLKASLMELEVARSRLREKFTPDAQPLREVESQIRQARQILAKETATRVQEKSTRRNPNYESLQAALLGAEARLSSLQAREAVLRQHVQDYHAITQQLDTLGFQMAPLQRELDLNVKSYLGYLKKEEEARFSQALDHHDIGNLKIAEPAHLPIEPIAPRRKMNLLLGFVLGTTVALGFAFVIDRADHSLKTPGDIEQHLGLPLLASVPVHKQEA